jgi:hypothetical protein
MRSHSNQYETIAVGADLVEPNPVIAPAVESLDAERRHRPLPAAPNLALTADGEFHPAPRAERVTDRVTEGG